MNKMLSKLIGSGENREIFNKSFSSLSFRILSYVFGFAFVFIITRFFSVEAQGIFSIVLTIMSLLTLLSKLGIQTAMVKWLSIYFFNQEEGNARHFFLKVYRLIFCLSVGLAILLFVFAEDIALSFFNKSSLILPIKIIAFAVPFFTSTEIISNYFRSKKKIIIYSFYNYAAKFTLPLTFLVIAVLIGFKPKELYTPVYVFVAGIVVTGIFALAHVSKDVRSLSTTVLEDVSYKKILKTSLPMLFSSSLVMIMWWSDTFILGVYKAEEDVGIYSVAVKIATIVSFVYSAVIAILLPKIAGFYSSQKTKELKQTLQFSARLIFIATTPIVIILALFPEFFLSIFGEEYKEGRLILLLLLAAQFTNSLTGPVGPFLNMSGNERQQLAFIIIALVLNIFLSIYLVDEYGGEGVAFGSAIGMITWNVLGALYIKFKIGYQTWIKLFSKI